MQPITRTLITVLLVIGGTTIFSVTFYKLGVRNTEHHASMIQQHLQYEVTQKDQQAKDKGASNQELLSRLRVCINRANATGSAVVQEQTSCFREAYQAPQLLPKPTIDDLNNLPNIY